MALYLLLCRLARDGRCRCGVWRRHRAGHRCGACHRDRRWRRYWRRHHARYGRRYRRRCRRDGNRRHACRDWRRRYGSGRHSRSSRRSGAGRSRRGRCGRRRRQWRRGRQRFCHRHRHRRSHAIGRRCQGGYRHGALQWRAHLARQAVVAALGLGQRPHHGRRHGGQDGLGRCRRGCGNCRRRCLAWRYRPRWRSRWHAGFCCHCRGRQTACLGLCHWCCSTCRACLRRSHRYGCRYRHCCRGGHGGRRWRDNRWCSPHRLGEQGQRGGRDIGQCAGHARVDRCQDRRRSAVRCRCGRRHTKIHDHA